MESFQHAFCIYTRLGLILQLSTTTIILTFRTCVDGTVNTAMVLTLMDLTKEFSPTLAYTCSDELTLVFPPNDTKTVVYGVFDLYCAVSWEVLQWIHWG